MSLTVSLVPEERLLQRDDLVVFDEDCAPGGDAAIVEVVVANDFEIRPPRASNVLIRDLPRLHVVAHFFRAIFETDGEAGPPGGAPVEAEVVALAGCDVHGIDDAEIDFPEARSEHGVIGLSEDAAVQKLRRFAKFKGVVQGQRQHINPHDGGWTQLAGGAAGEQNKRKKEGRPNHFSMMKAVSSRCDNLKVRAVRRRLTAVIVS